MPDEEINVRPAIRMREREDWQWQPMEVPVRYEAVLFTKKKEVDNTTELQKLEKQIREDIFDNDSLRAAIRTAGSIKTLERIKILTRGLGAVTNCSDCHQICFANTLRSCYGGMRWTCPSCSGSYTFCSSCDSLILTEDNLLHFHVADLTRLRNENRVDRFDANVMAGNRKPRGERRSKPKWTPTRYFGVEIELERKTDILVPPDLILKAKYALANGFSMIKHDGSLRAAPGNPQNGSNGFEVVSLPGTMAYHRDHAGWHNFFEVLKPWMEEAPNTTGLHVHVSAASMTRATIGKLVKFVNSIENLGFMQMIANRDFTKPNPNGRFYANVFANADTKVKELISKRRHAADCDNSPLERIIRCYYRDDKKAIQYDNYAHPIIQRIEPSASRIVTCKCPEGDYDYEGHYAAFNVLTHKPTVEFRMFQGSTNETHFWAALEFTDAIVEFCEATSFNNLSCQEFISWFKEHRYLYKSLARWLVVGGLIEPLKKKES